MAYTDPTQRRGRPRKQPVPVDALDRVFAEQFTRLTKELDARVARVTRYRRELYAEGNCTLGDAELVRLR